MGRSRSWGPAVLAGCALLGVAPVGLLAGLPQPPAIPAGVVADRAPVAPEPEGLVRLTDASFVPLGEDVDTGAVIDPFTGQPKIPAYLGVDGERITPDRIRRFLDRYRSPMAPYAKAIVKAGKRHGVDPRLVVAISGTESSFGRFHKGYNAWGWDAPRGLTRWGSWEESIDAYTRLFATGYRNHDPRVIGPRYAPFAPNWPASTRLFFSLI